MSNDNKTLADVQPGGRVRLGDQAERARFEDWYVRNAFDYVANPLGSRDCDLQWKGWQAALAARQPVGEPFGWWLADENGIGYIARNPGQGVIDVYRARPGCSAMPLYTAPTAQQPAQVHLDGLDRALGEAIDQRDRYHEVADDLAGHIAAITGVDIGEHSSSNCPWQNAIEATEEYKPAQAVDLARWSQRHADDLHVAVHTALSVHAGSLSQKKRAAISAYVKRLLIDSQAVGNG